MPKVPRDVDPRRLIRLLERHGWIVVRQASHTILQKDDVHVAVPHHGPLKTGTLRAILKLAKISVAAAAKEL